MNKLSILFFFAIFFSCRKENISSKVSFEISNKSSAAITTVELYTITKDTTQVGTLNNVAINFSKNLEIDLKNYTQSDGAYLIRTISENGIKQSIRFGYFSNGKDTQQKDYQVEILDSSLQVK